jgi:putative transposase
LLTANEGLGAMPYDPQRHHRQSTRLRGYEYSQPGAYFVTICVEGRKPLLGRVVDGVMELNELGRIVLRAWDDLPLRFATIQMDAFVVMPNHVHGVVILGASDPAILGGKDRASPVPTNVVPPLGAVVGAFKSLTGIPCNRLLGRAGVPFWQARFHDHVIRNDVALDRIRAYIENNPACWETDEENPDSGSLRG